MAGHRKLLLLLESFCNKDLLGETHIRSLQLVSSMSSAGKESTCHAGDEGSTFRQEDTLEKEMATKISIFACEIPEARSLMGYISWDRKELDTTYCQNIKSN